MSSEFTFISSVVGPDWEPYVSAGLVAGLVVSAGTVAAGNLKSSKNPLIPESRLTIRGFFELVAELLLWLGDTAMGKENRKFLPFVGTIFLYVFFMNLLGLVPGFVMPTHGFLFNMGIAATVFVFYNAWGIKELGVVAYLKHLCGPDFKIKLLGFTLYLPLLAPLLLPIEVISHFIRPLSLSLRLFGNMTGDHAVVGVFTKLTEGTPVFFIPVIFYILGTVVSLIQAFVFTLLTMIYIRLAVAHEDHGDEEHGAEAGHHAQH